MKPYQTIPIQDCGEPLQPIPRDAFVTVEPHYYESLGAPYGKLSPYCLRQGVLEALLKAQAMLSTHQPGWRIQIFDAYRPVAVQQFMVDFTFRELLQLQGFDSMMLTEAQQHSLMEQVYQFWAAPSLDPTTPPPHSTGAAVDVTLVDANHSEVDMGSPIDEVSPRSYPDHFANSQNPQEQQWHAHRSLLNSVMQAAGFRRHPNEWWHFSLGDQLWAWLDSQETGNPTIARYGRASEVVPGELTAAAKSGVLSPAPNSSDPR